MGNKRSLRLVLIAAAAIIMIFTMTAAVFAESSGSLNGNINWTLDDSGTLTITGTGAMPDYSNRYQIKPQQIAKSHTSSLLMK